MVRRARGLLALAAACACAASANVAQAEEVIQLENAPGFIAGETALWQTLARDEYWLRGAAGVIREPALASWLASVLCNVAADRCEEMRLYVLRGHHFNAAATPSGMLLVSTGLLLRVADEAQLAAVLAHEAAHYERLHALERWREMRSSTATMEAVKTVITEGIGIPTFRRPTATDEYDNALDRFAAEFSLLDSLSTYIGLRHVDYSPEAQSEADRIAVARLSQAGYDAGASALLWAAVRREAEALDGFAPMYLINHPRASSVKAAPRASARSEAPLPQIAPFRNNWLTHARQGLPLELERALIERQREIGAPAGLVAYHEASMLRRRGDEADALRAFATAVESSGHPAAAHRDFGLALWQAGQAQRAAAAFTEYLSRAPEAADRAIVQSHLNEILQP